MNSEVDDQGRVDGPEPWSVSLQVADSDAPADALWSDRRVRILLVEDDPAELLALRSILAPLGHTIIDASSGAAARRCVIRGEFAVIVIDLRGRAGDFFETAAFLRSHPRSQLTPIIFVATLDRAEREMAIGYEMGIVDFVFAPAVGEALLGKVSLFADLFGKTEELIERDRLLGAAAKSSADALAFQLELLDRMELFARAQSDFVSKISHELRSPLTSVIGYAELLLDGGPGEPTAQQRHMLAIIERNSRRLLLLIEDLLTLSCVEAGTFELELGPVDLHDVVEQVRETVAPALSKAELSLVTDIDPDTTLVGDRVQLERALLNLVSNSVKFAAPGGRIEIRTRIEGGDVAIAVVDSGCGIPLDEQGHLFTRFFRANRSKEGQVPGTGLGLYLVQQIVELHGGTMRVESSPLGSTFTMLVPACGPPADPLALIRGR